MKIDDIKRQPILLMFAVIIVIILLVGIFRTIAPYLSLGFGAYAHIGDVRGAISFETFENKGKVVLFLSDSCGYCQDLKGMFPKDDSGNPIYPDFIKIYNTAEQEFTDLGADIQGVPTIRYYKDEVTKDNVNDSTAFVEFDGSDRTPDEIKMFFERQSGGASNSTPSESS